MFQDISALRTSVTPPSRPTQPSPTSAELDVGRIISKALVAYNSKK